MSNASTELIRVLVVDDSAFVRKMMRQMLSRSPFIEVVGAARDGNEALEMVEQLKPDVVTLDLNMPNADGLTFLRAQMSRRPLPVVVVSTVAKDDDHAIAALELGAIDVVQKATGMANEKLLEIADELVLKVKNCAAARVRPIVVDSAPISSRLASASSNERKVDIVAIGISTGGPQALKQLIPRLPVDFPVPVVIVMHMPRGYTELYARSLNEASPLNVVEAHEGDLLKPGTVTLAPGGYHLSFVRSADGAVRCHLDLRPIDAMHRPSVNVLFRSVAEVFGARALGVVMTGMGSDGTAGATWMKAQGCRIIAEAEESCVVYGMPRSIVEAGMCDETVALGRMPEAISVSI